MNKAKTGQISHRQLFCLLIIIRLATLVLSNSVSYVQFAAELSVTAVLSAAAFFTVKITDGTYPKAVKILLAVLFAASPFADLFSYYQFTTQVAHPEVPVWVIGVVLAGFSVYSGLLKTEAVARFSALAVTVVLLCIGLTVLTNIKEIRPDFFAAAQNEKIDLASLIKCFDVPILYLLLAPKTSEHAGRSLTFSVAASYSVYIGVVMMCRAVLGKTVNYYKSPVFALFQLGEAGNFTKLDLLYICTVLVLLFCELSLAVSIFAETFKKKVKC